MAAEPKSDKPSEEMKRAKADPSSKINDVNPSPKDGVLSDATSCISSVDAGGSIKESELDQESPISEQNIYYPPGSYYGYYYPGLDGTYVDWSDPNYLVQGSGFEAQQSVMQSDSGQVMYYAPGFQPGYGPYGACVPGAMVGVDGQYVYQQPYVLGTVLPQPPGSPAYVTSPVGYGGPELVPAYSWDSLFWDGYSVNAFDSTLSTTAQKTKSNSKTQPSKNNNPTQKLNLPTERKGQSPVLELPPSIEVVNQPVKPVNKSANLPKNYFPAAKVPSFAPQGSPGIVYRANPVNAKEMGRNWFDPDKLKARNKSNIAGNFDMLSEQNRGPRIDNLKTTWTSVASQTATPAGGTDNKTGSKMVVIKRDDYNLLDFPTKYDHALFFVIKSYSEDDIHKSIKYNVWASTPNGNRRLDNAYQDAQEKMSEKGSKCPVFLFFSVNASGQFCGVAEMIGRVDFNKNMDFWQQDKWNGFFPVKWHVIKDVPNPQFRHIILENNDNKPVTNSRDTQEVKFPQGIEMLNIFKSFTSRTSILDDFGFYENRQKVMLEKRGRISTPTSQQLPPKVDEVPITAKPDEVVPVISSLEALDLSSTKVDAGAKTSEVQVAVAVVE